MVLCLVAVELMGIDQRRDHTRKATTTTQERRRPSFRHHHAAVLLVVFLKELTLLGYCFLEI